MTTSPTTPPEQHVIRITDTQAVPDVAAYIVAILRAEWKPENTDGIRPNIDTAENHNQIRFTSEDWITVYEASQSSEPVGVTYQWTHDTIVVTLDMFTGPPGPGRGGATGTRPHLMKMMAEARRVLLNHRTDVFGSEKGINTQGRQWMRWGVRIADFERTTRNFYRRAVDCEVLWRFRPV